MTQKKHIGVLAFQGGVIEHQAIIEKLGHYFVPVRNKKDLKRVEALIIPGGESTTIGFFLEETGLMEEIKKRSKQKMPIWGTCAGAIILAKKIIAHRVPPHLGIMDITVERNAYGKQIHSFYTEIKVPALKIMDLKAAFIRAPIIKKLGPKVKILASHKNMPVIVQQEHLLASTFHPELREDSRLHHYFISLCK